MRKEGKKKGADRRGYEGTMDTNKQTSNNNKTMYLD